jgi:mRNA-degrading endonuclease YafQ of YafQ-DinJ toxin-antitoxin module
VLRPEYLAAIMLQTNRPKDRTRLTAFVEEAKMDKANLERILKDHGLTRKWQEFGRRFRAK